MLGWFDILLVVRSTDCALKLDVLFCAATKPARREVNSRVIDSIVT